MKFITQEEIKLGVLTGEINIIYNCASNEIGTALIKMKIMPTHCPRFELKWIKECKPIISFVPNIDLGINSYNNIIQRGVKLNNDVFSSNTTNPFILKTHPSALYISRGNSQEKISIRPIQINYPNERGIYLSFNGQLLKGGVLPSFPTLFLIDFTCKIEKMIDFEVIIPFEDNHIMKMYLKTECKMFPRRGFLKLCFIALYWVLVTLLIFLLVILAYFYFIKGPISFDELYSQGKEYIQNVLGITNTKHMQLPDKSNDNTQSNGNSDEMNDEEDLLDCQIKVNTKKDLPEDNVKQVNLDKESQIDYGGI